MADWRIKAEDVDESMLVPLVPKGRDREEVIEELIEAWATPVEGTEDWAPWQNTIPGVTLNRVDLVDQNNGKAIDLTELLARLTARLQHDGRVQEPTEGSDNLPAAVPTVHCYLRGCRIRACDTSSQPDKLVVPYTCYAVGCTFSGGASFTDAAFSGNASFDRAAFSGSASFRGAAFSGRASFIDAAFSGNAWFADTSFSGEASFDRAAFSRHAWFGGAAFSKDLNADGATFVEQPVFTHCRFSDGAVLGNGAFHCATFYTNARDDAQWQRPPPERARAKLRFELWTALRIKTHWGIVRSVGELAILNRVSLSALVVVPILAGLWPAIRAAVQRYSDLHWRDGLLSRASDALIGSMEHAGAAPGGWYLPGTMPWSWAALFFAALFVVIGRAVYQAACPQFVRERSRFDVMRDEMEEFRRTRDSEGDRRLQEAIDDIKQAGEDERLGWFWHPNLVRHNGRPVWIPASVDDFAYEPREVTLPEGVDPPEGLGDGPLMTAPAVMSQTSREDVAVQQGASARYDIIARQNQGALHGSLWCYVAAGVLVVLVVWKQAMSILMEVGWESLVLLALWLVWIGLAVFVLGTGARVACAVLDVEFMALLRRVWARVRGAKRGDDEAPEGGLL